MCTSEYRSKGVKAAEAREPEELQALGTGSLPLNVELSLQHLLNTCFGHRVLVYRSGWPQTYYPAALVSQGLKLQKCVTVADSC